MPWERRGSHCYYYRARRKGAVVEKQYFGKGPIAESVARQDAEARRKRVNERAAVRRLDESIASIAAVMVDLDAGVRMLSDGTLLAAGCHQHKGMWRKQRGRKPRDN